MLWDVFAFIIDIYYYLGVGKGTNNNIRYMTL